jgi:hypothetical protein
LNRGSRRTARDFLDRQTHLSLSRRLACPCTSKPQSSFSINGIKELWTVCTSHIERFNLTVRTFLKRFTRLALGFSKKLDNLKASVSAFIAFYNFCWRTRHKGKSGKLRPTAAMMAGLTDRLWTFADLFDAVTLAEKDRKSNERYARLAAKLAERN